MLEKVNHIAIAVANLDKGIKIYTQTHKHINTKKDVLLSSSFKKCFTSKDKKKYPSAWTTTTECIPIPAPLEIFY